VGPEAATSVGPKAVAALGGRAVAVEEAERWCGGRSGEGRGTFFCIWIFTSVMNISCCLFLLGIDWNILQ
jgi:hypothetical protein